MSLDFVVGDTQPSLFGTLTIGGTAVDLTAATGVRFQMRSSVDNRFAVDAAATIVTRATGSVRYDWAPDDLNSAGSYVGRWRIFWNDGTQQSSDPVNKITISPA